MRTHFLWNVIWFFWRKLIKYWVCYVLRTFENYVYGTAILKSLGIINTDCLRLCSLFYNLLNVKTGQTDKIMLRNCWSWPSAISICGFIIIRYLNTWVPRIIWVYTPAVKLSHVCIYNFNMYTAYVV